MSARPAKDWCADLATALSMASISPTLERVGDVRALLAAPPAEMLLGEWRELVTEARGWLLHCETKLPAFRVTQAIDAALRCGTGEVPGWAKREVEA